MNEQDVAVLILKMQQQLAILEKKIDILISQSQPRPFRERPFSKPYRPFDRPHRSFEKRPGEEGQGFGHKRKPYDNPRESGFSQGRHFEKHPGEANRGRVFDPKNKPFHSYRRKDSGR